MSSSPDIVGYGNMWTDDPHRQEVSLFYAGWIRDVGRRCLWSDPRKTSKAQLEQLLRNGAQPKSDWWIQISAFVVCLVSREQVYIFYLSWSLYSSTISETVDYGVHQYNKCQLDSSSATEDSSAEAAFTSAAQLQQQLLNPPKRSRRVPACYAENEAVKSREDEKFLFNKELENEANAAAAAAAVEGCNKLEG